MTKRAVSTEEVTFVEKKENAWQRFKRKWTEVMNQKMPPGLEQIYMFTGAGLGLLLAFFMLVFVHPVETVMYMLALSGPVMLIISVVYVLAAMRYHKGGVDN